MQLIRAGDHTFGYRMTVRDHHIIAGEIDLLYRNRHQRKEVTVKPAKSSSLLDPSEHLQKRGGEGLTLIMIPGISSGGVDEAEQIRIGEMPQHLRKHFFRTRISD